MPPLLTPLDQRTPERLHYLGVSYGVTTKLFNFWGKAGFVPVYMRQTTNELTGEHSCIMIKPLNTQDMVSGPEEGGVITLRVTLQNDSCSCLVRHLEN